MPRRWCGPCGTSSERIGQTNVVTSKSLLDASCLFPPWLLSADHASSTSRTGGGTRFVGKGSRQQQTLSTDAGFVDLGNGFVKCNVCTQHRALETTFAWKRQRDHIEKNKTHSAALERARVEAAAASSAEAPAPLGLDYRIALDDPAAFQRTAASSGRHIESGSSVLSTEPVFEFEGVIFDAATGLPATFSAGAEDAEELRRGQALQNFLSDADTWGVLDAEEVGRAILRGYDHSDRLADDEIAEAEEAARAFAGMSLGLHTLYCLETYT
jgi:hypothetical protein